MICVQLLLVLSFSVFLSPIICQGRRPQPIEHNYCSLVYADELEQARKIDRRAISQAYNVGQNGSLCQTTCRIMSRGNIKRLDAQQSPNFIQCAQGPQYCYKGACTNEKELSQLLKKERQSSP